jgi:hypothetical protein
MASFRVSDLFTDLSTPPNNDPLVGWQIRSTGDHFDSNDGPLKPIAISTQPLGLYISLSTAL